MINDLKFGKITRIPIAPARVIQAPASFRSVSSIPLSKVKWLDDPNALTVTAILPTLPNLLIMGGTAKTPYNPAWTDADATAALLAQLGGITVTNGVASLLGAPAPAPATPPALPGSAPASPVQKA